MKIVFCSRRGLVWLAFFILSISLLYGCGADNAPADLAATPTAAVTVTSAGGNGSSTRATPTAAEASTPTASLSAPSAQATPDSNANSQPSISFGYTHQRADGNRFVAGQGALPEVEPVDIELLDVPAWVVAAPIKGGSLWAVVLADGRVQGFSAVDGAVEEISIEPEQLMSEMPPLLKVEAGLPTLLTPPVDAPSPLTPPAMLSDGRLAWVHAGGQVMIENESDFTPVEVEALPDARLLQDEAERLLVLTEPTLRYAHGVLGDRLEAATITLIETVPTPRIALTIPISEPSVVEGIAPIWADLSGDGVREIIATLSNAEQGAQVVVFDAGGQRMAAGPAIGQGNRWRHQLAVAPFGPDSGLELVDVLTPHIGGLVEFYRLEGDQLRIVAQVPGYTSHVIGTRNLDMALAGDVDGDGRVELLLPNQNRTELGGIRRTDDGAEVVWTVPVDGVVNSNLAAATIADGSLAVGLGRSDGVLRLWLP